MSDAWLAGRFGMEWVGKRVVGDEEAAFGSLIKSFEFTVSKTIADPLKTVAPNLWKEWEKLSVQATQYYGLPQPYLELVPFTDIQIAGIIRRTINVIEKYGWVQGELGNKDRGFCVLGAIDHVTETTYTSNQVVKRFREWLSSYTDRINVPHWNDDKSRTKEEVILYLHKFADELDPAGAGEFHD